VPIISGGGGGGFTPVSVVALMSAVDMHASNGYDVKWTGLIDNVYDANTLTSIPAGLGISFAFDGSNATLTTTTAGVWNFTLLVAPFDTDTQWRAAIHNVLTGFNPQIPTSVDQTFSGQDVGSFALPSGASWSYQIEVTEDSVLNPYPVIAELSIVRIA